MKNHPGLNELRYAVISLTLILIFIFLLSAVHSANNITKNDIKYKGVNLAGAEGGWALPGAYGYDYVFPSTSEIDYFISKGFNLFRIPIRWERLQPDLYGELNDTELERLDNIINYATSKKAYVIIDIHNYGRYIDKNERIISANLFPGYNGKIVGINLSNLALSNLWYRVASKYKDNNYVILGLMNEPHDIPSDAWVESANSAIKSIRKAGAQNLILVPGSGWTGAYSWNDTWYGTPNAESMLNVIDPADNYAIEAHQYLDEDASGESCLCVDTKIGSSRLMEFTSWLKKNKKKALLAEFAGGRNGICYAAMDDMLNCIENNSDVWLGWCYWTAGPNWGDYIFTVEPDMGRDRPQMMVLINHLKG